MELRGTAGILTGASRGIGVYLADALASEGVDLALASRSVEDLEKTAARIARHGTKVICVPTDVTRREDLDNLVDRATSELGPIDLLVNNAGVERYAPFHEYDFDAIGQIMQTNIVSVQWLTRMVLPSMVERKRGHIANIASVAGKMAVPYNSVYSASKHALVGFSWSLREELMKYGVGVSVICPGFVAEAGMFADWSKGKRPPGLATTVDPEEVASETIEAIVKNRGEVIVASPMMKLTKVMPHGVSGAVGRKSGGFTFLEKVAVEAWKEDPK
ncbi:MAG: SDR family NAD(P)-dependent oxidoreductase [Actinomycetota bacterium]